MSTLIKTVISRRYTKQEVKENTFWFPSGDYKHITLDVILKHIRQFPQEEQEWAYKHIFELEKCEWFTHMLALMYASDDDIVFISQSKITEQLEQHNTKAKHIQQIGLEAAIEYGELPAGADINAFKYQSTKPHKVNRRIQNLNTLGLINKADDKDTPDKARQGKPSHTNVWDIFEYNSE